MGKNKLELFAWGLGRAGKATAPTSAQEPGLRWDGLGQATIPTGSHESQVWSQPGRGFLRVALTKPRNPP